MTPTRIRTLTQTLRSSGPRVTALLTALLLSTGIANTALAQQDLSLECIVEPEMTIELASAIDGVVREVSVDKSDEIKAGQTLAKLESSLEEAAVALARSRANMTEEIEAKRIQLGLAKRKKERVLELFAKKSVPGFEKDEAIADAGLAQLELNRARSNQKLRKLELESAIADLELRSTAQPHRRHCGRPLRTPRRVHQRPATAQDRQNRPHARGDHRRQ